MAAVVVLLKADIMPPQAVLVVVVVSLRLIPLTDKELNHNNQAILQLMDLETQAELDHLLLATTLEVAAVLVQQVDRDQPTLVVKVDKEKITQSLVRQ